MAVNSVPLGQAGTGAAYILGEDIAAHNFNRNLQNYQLQQQKNKQLEQQNAMAIADSYRKNMLAASDGKLFSKQLSDLEQKHIKQGMDYMSQGFDIYRPNPNDPKQVQAAEQYMSDRRIIDNLRNYRKGIETKFNDINNAISKANIGEYNQADIDKMHEFINGTDILDAYRSGADLPEVRKNFNERKALQGIKAFSDLDKRVIGNNTVETTKINVPKTEQAIISSIEATQGGSEYLQEVTKGVPINFIKQLPKTKEEIRKRVEQDLNGSSIQEKAQLAELGIIKGTKRYDDYIEQSVNDFYEAKRGYDGLIDRGMGMASSGFKAQEKITPLMTPLQQENLNIAKRRLALAEQNAAGNVNMASQPQDLEIPFADGKGITIGRGYVKAPMSTKNFAGSTAVDLSTGKPIKLNTSSNDYEVVGVANFPFITKGNQKGYLSQYSFAQNNPSVIEEKPMIHVQLKEGGLTSDYLIPYDRLPDNLSKANREALSSFVPASGKKTTNQPKTTISRSDLASRASASGYSVSEYEKLLKQKGIKIQ